MPSPALKHLVRIASTLVFSVISSTSLQAQPAQSLRLASVLPAETPIYLSLPKPARLFLDEFRNPVFLAALKNIPNIGNQLENPGIDQLKAVLGALSATEDISWTEMTADLLAGPAEIALAPPSKLLIMVKPADAARLNRIHTKLLQFAEDDASNKGRENPVRRFTHNDINAFSFAPNEAHCIYEGHFLLASSEKILTEAIDKLKSSTPPANSLANDAQFKAARSSANPEPNQAWAFARMKELRKTNMRALNIPEEYNPLMALLFGGWVEAFRNTDWLGLTLSWKDARLGLEASIPVSPELAKGELRTAFTPPADQHAPKPIHIPGQLGTLSLWRYLSKVWNIRDSVVRGPARQGLNNLDNGIGQFFGGRDFGTGVLGALQPDWRLVVAEQDLVKLKPRPDIVLPAFALTVGYNTKDEDFRQRWIIAFQSIVGVINVTGAQQKQPSLIQNQEQFEGATVFSAAYLAPADQTSNKPKSDATAKPNSGNEEPSGVHIRHNFRPTLAFAGDQLIIATTSEVARDVIRSLKSATGSNTPADSFSVELNGSRIAALIDTNRERLVMQNMVEKGHGRKAALNEIGALEALIKGLNHAQITAHDTPENLRLRLSFDLNQTK